MEAARTPLDQLRSATKFLFGPGKHLPEGADFPFVPVAATVSALLAGVCAYLGDSLFNAAIAAFCALAFLTICSWATPELFLSQLVKEPVSSAALWFLLMGRFLLFSMESVRGPWILTTLLVTSTAFGAAASLAILTFGQEAEPEPRPPGEAFAFALVVAMLIALVVSGPFQGFSALFFGTALTLLLGQIYQARKIPVNSASLRAVFYIVHVAIFALLAVMEE